MRRNSSQKTTLILGATKGLGKQIAIQSHNKGDYVIEVGSSIRFRQESGPDTLLLPCDLNNPHSVGQFVRELGTSRAGAHIDKFFWVAGRLLKGSFARQAPEELMATIDINFRNSVLVAHAVWVQMQKTQRPCTFTVIASTSGVTPRSDEAIYVATKHAQVGFTRSLGMENTNPNVKVSLFMPSGMQTRFWDNNPTSVYDEFLNPAKVATKIIQDAEEQASPFVEISIPRGSL